MRVIQMKPNCNAARRYGCMNRFHLNNPRTFPYEIIKTKTKNGEPGKEPSTHPVCIGVAG
jgi:hypothetical protein